MTSGFQPGHDYSFLLAQPEKLQALLAAYKPTPHPVYTLPTPEQLVAILQRPDGRAVLEQGLNQREDKIAQMDRDPFHYGYDATCWPEARRLLATHRLLHITSRNRNTKSEFGAVEAMRVLMRGGTRVWCLCLNEQTSMRGGGQQELIFKYMPPEVKAAALNTNRKAKTEFGVSYSATGRFTDKAFIMPTATKPSECRFMTYQMDPKVIEGGAIDFFWADEEVPWDWVKKLLIRLIDRNGKGLITCTPASGWDETYAAIYDGADVKSWQDYPLHKDRIHWPGGPRGKIPFVVEPIDPRFAGMFFPVDANPWVPFEEFLKEFATYAYEEQLIVCAGVARKGGGAQFPKFGKPHLIPAAKVPKAGTNFHFVDFAWSRNWSNLWVRVVRIKDRVTFYVYRDWPDKRSHGPWAERSNKPGGKRGPATEKTIVSVDGYVQLIRKLERQDLQDSQNSAPNPENPVHPVEEMICQRFGDPRSGSAQAVSADDDRAGQNFFNMLAAAGLPVSPVSLLGEERFIGEGIKQINDLLDYDQDQYRNDGNQFTPFNSPRLFISEECEQVIDCLTLWTPHGPVKDQACKDFIDLLRYMAVSELDDWGNHPMQCVGGGHY